LMSAAALRVAAVAMAAAAMAAVAVAAAADGAVGCYERIGIAGFVPERHQLEWVAGNTFESCAAMCDRLRGRGCVVRPCALPAGACSCPLHRRATVWAGGALPWCARAQQGSAKPARPAAMPR